MTVVFLCGEDELDKERRGYARAFARVAPLKFIEPSDDWRDRLPDDWLEGTEVEVEKAPNQDGVPNGVHPTDAWMDELEAIASQGDPADDARLISAIEEIRRREKDLARKKLGLA